MRMNSASFIRHVSILIKSLTRQWIVVCSYVTSSYTLVTGGLVDLWLMDWVILVSRVWRSAAFLCNLKSLQDLVLWAFSQWQHMWQIVTWLINWSWLMVCILQRLIGCISIQSFRALNVLRWMSLRKKLGKVLKCSIVTFRFFFFQFNWNFNIWKI